MDGAEAPDWADRMDGAAGLGGNEAAIGFRKWGGVDVLGRGMG